MNEKRKQLFPLFLVAGGVLIFLAGVAWMFLNNQPQTVLTPTPGFVGQVQRVSLEDAKAAFDAGAAVFLDVRASSSYETSHISGAVLIPLNELPARLGELDPDSWIIPY